MSNHPVSRQPQGQPAGGEFATTDRASSGLHLAADDDGEDIDQYVGPSVDQVEHAADRLNAMYAANVNDPKAETLIAARGIATFVRDHYPEATEVVTDDQCGQAGCSRQHVVAIRNADGTPAVDRHGDSAIDHFEELDGSEIDFTSLEDGLQRPGNGGYDTEGNVWQGISGTIDVDAALATSPDERTAQERADKTIDSYRARFDDLDVDDATAARDMLTDLHHWARANGHDFDEIVTAAGEVADEEAAPGS